MRIKCFTMNLVTAAAVSVFWIAVLHVPSKAQSPATCAGCGLAWVGGNVVYPSNYLCGNGRVVTTASACTEPGATETARIVVQAKADADPDYLKFREVFSSTDVKLQRYRVTCASGAWKLDWETLGAYLTADAATAEMTRLVRLETQNPKFVTFSKEGR